MKKITLLLFAFILVNVHYAKAQNVIDWDYTSDIVLENDGQGNGVRAKLYFDNVDVKKTIELSLLEGEFKSITIYAVGKDKDDPEEIVYHKVSEKYEFFNSYTQEAIQGLNSWKIDKNEFIDYEYFLFTLNGHYDEFEKVAPPTKLKLSTRPLTSEEKHTSSKIGSFFLIILLIGGVGAVYYYSNKKINTMIADRAVSNTSIKTMVITFAVIIFIVAIFITYIGSPIIGYLTKAQRGFNNNMGIMLIVIVIADIVNAFKTLGKINYNRCPACHKFGDIIDLGSEYAGSETTTKYQNNNVVGKTTTHNYNDYRKCPECNHVWSVQRSSVSSWGK